MLTEKEKAILETHMGRSIYSVRGNLVVFSGGKFLAMQTAREIIERTKNHDTK